ncbi:complement receptor type 2 [Alligator mississippiensis]|uniref:complement receptor type 2 n=1 Tax=Alligator mississippiensis TaxID=8496 RepID=UPI002877BD40|nr:complement receptor type 2 [Alligator mississippiensis]
MASGIPQCQCAVRISMNAREWRVYVRVTCGSLKVQNGKATGTKPVHNPRDTVTVECDAGYAVNGTHESQCQDDGTWVPPVLLCERVLQCPLPPNITHAEHSSRDVETFTPGMSVNYSCEPGYSLVGEGLINCTTSGAWSLPLPRCEAVTCLNPEILNGRNLDGWTTTYSPGDSVRLKCSAGYSLNGSREIVCGEDGAWHPPVPVCNQVTCGSPKVQNGKATGTKPVHNPRDTVTVECDAGYAVNGTLESRCQDDGTWDPPVLVCERVRQCPLPPNITHAEHSSRDVEAFTPGMSVNYSSVTCPNPEILNGRNLDEWTPTYSPGDRVRFECSAGYSLNSSHEIQCRNDGIWDPPVPVCSQVTCGSPKVQNGKATGTKPVHNPRDTVTVECDAGYAVNGTHESQCQDNGTWDPPVLVCERVRQCPLPPNITHAEHSSRDVETFTPGMSVNYSCEPGYSLVGEGSIYCTTSGAWSLPLPLCEAVTCPNPEILNGRNLDGWTATYSPGDSVRLECSAGYSLNGSREIVCGEDGAWHPPVSVCNQVTCGSLKVQNGKATGAKPVHNPRDTVTVECDAGYAVNGTLESRCQDDGTWDPPVLVCLRAIANGKHSAQALEAFPSGMSVNYSCDPGYSLVGEASIHCTESGNWSLPFPLCAAIVCRKPEVQNGRILELKPVYNPRDTVTVECDPGYTVSSTRGSRCQDDGTWDPQVLTCEKAITCTNPEIHDGRKLDERGPMYKPGDRVQFECSAGYSLNGSREIQCGEDGAWDPAIPVCSRVVCGTPNVPSGRISGLKPVYNPRDTVTVECDLGYAVNGTRESRCQNDGTWDPPVPICKRVPQCHLPPNITHAKHSSQDVEIFPPGVSVNYSCEPGYSLVGEGWISCTASGAWSLPLPHCEGKSCSYPEEPENGTAVLTDLLIGSTVNYSCEEGYRLIGEAQRRCEISDMDVAWSGTAPICELSFAAVMCTTPEIPNGREVDGYGARYTAGHSVSFECNADYILNGSHEIQCQQDGNWDPPIPVCIQVSVAGCGAPRAQNGKLTGLKPVYDPGDTVTVECEPDYAVNGTRQSRCRGDGTWDPPVIVCERVLRCPLPPSISNGKLSSQASAVFTPGMSASYSCDPGYTVTGEASISCTESGTWSLPIPQCKGKSCSYPEEPENGTAVLTDLLIGSTVNYSCEEGYRLIGEAQRRCEISDMDVAWSGTAPICELSFAAVMCTTPEIPNGREVDGYGARYTAGHSVSFECNADYILNGSHEIQCQQDGNWDPPIPVCIQVSVAGCGAPRAQNGKLTGLKPVYDPGDTVTVECEPDYAVNGTRQSRCRGDGTWDPPVIVCERVLRCPLPPSISNGKLSSQASAVFTPGMSASYSCDPGYTVTGEASISCTESGTWSLPIPQCKGKSCSYPEEPENGTAVLTDLLIGSTVNYSCEEGYRLIGEAQRRCEISDMDVAWSGTAPICEPVMCTTPEIPNGREVDGYGARYTAGHSVSFECNADYILNGSHEIQCQQDGNWDPPIPVCIPVLLCPPPPAVANGMHNAQAQETFPSGMSVNYSCDPGYSLHGEASIHCTESGNWSFPYPLCAEAVICTTPEIPNGRNLDGRRPVYRPGDRVRVECNDMLALNGIQEIRCMENGTWDPPIPDCSLDQPRDSFPPMKFILKHQCPSPPTITNGKHSGQDLEVFTPGVSVNYSCEPGFSLAGETSIHCTASGTWNQPFPSCKGCAAPPAIANGNRSIQDSKEFAYGSSVTHSCDMGFLLIGEATSQCTSSGTWVPPIPYCKEMRCVVPDVPGIGKAMMGMTYPIGTNLTIQCDDDYMLEGSSLIQCQDDLSWDPPMPVCSSAFPSLGSYSAISAVTGVSVTMLLVLLVMGIVWRVASKKKEGYYHTYENYDHPIPMTVITDQKSSFAP